MHVCVITGLPGTGKTRYVLDKHGPENVFKIDSFEGQLWFDCYEGQKVLLLDDFYGGIRYSYMLNLLDRYRIRLPIKGGYKVSKWSYIYITSNSEPEKWYNETIDITALIRRIDKRLSL